MEFTFEGGRACHSGRPSSPKQLIMSRICRAASLPKQVVLIMQASAILLFAFCLQVSAAGYSQTVSFTGKDVPLKTVFASVKKQTGFGVFFQSGETATLEGSGTVTLDLKNVTLDLFLQVCLRNQPLEYSVEGSTIFIKKKEAKAVAVASGVPVTEIKGRVTNEKGEPLVNANITLKRSGHGTVTDADGNFTLRNVNPDDVIAVSFIGYQTQLIHAPQDKYLTMVLQPATNHLDKVVIQAYGTTTQRLATGNIGTVTKEELEMQPVSNPLQAMQGRIPGVSITQISGYASAPFKVEIRGRNTVSGAFPADPLYIIDGTPLTVVGLIGSSNYANGSSGFIQNDGITGPANGQSPFFSLNPQDIESIEVLKDADATAIYGSRGANGVILVSTKKGKAGKTKLDIRATQGISAVTRFYHLLNTQQYLTMRREAFANDGITPDAGNAPDLMSWDTTRFTDWQKKLWGNKGKNTDVQIALSGGDTRTSFRVAAGYNRTTNILTVSGADQRGSLSLNLNHSNIDHRFTLSLTTTYTFTQSDMVDISGLVALPPDAPSIYDSTGKLNFAGWEPIRNQYPSALSNLLQPYTAKTNFLNTNLGLSYQIAKGLSFRTNLGYNNAYTTQVKLITIASQDPITSPLGSAQFGNNTTKGWIIEPQLNFDRFIGKGKLNILAGSSLQSTSTDGLYVLGMRYTNDALLRTVSNAPTKYATDNYGQYKYAAIFGRINYNIGNEFIFNVNARRDGSSRFGNNHQFGNFASIGAAWVFTQEPWIQNIKWLSFGKLRASYGTTGSDGVGDYMYITRWQSNLLPTYGTVQPILPTQHANPNFRWQSNKKLEGALDIGLLKDRINLSAAYYRNRCNNQLVDFPLPEYTGFTTVTANSPALVQNSGWEFVASGKIVDTRSFKFSASFNVSFNRNKLISYPNFNLSPYFSKLAIGQPLNIVKVLHYQGVDPASGQYIFQDKNKDGNISNAFDSTGDLYNYNITQNYFGGLNLNFNYKGLNLSIFFNFIKQPGLNAYTGLFAGRMNNIPVELLSRWQKPGDQSNIARFTTAPTDSDVNFANYSDGIYTDASFIRLANLSLSYSFATDLVKKSKMQGASIFLHAQNLFLITKYKGIDPETQSFGGLPPARIVTCGLSFNF
jgi:TonB-linked SusC/RagA family outer membrane protein